MSARDSQTPAHKRAGALNVERAESFAQAVDTDRAWEWLSANSDEKRAELMVNSSLGYDDWKRISDTVVETREQSLGLVNEVMNLGLTKDLDLGVMVDTWQTLDNIDGGEMTMNPGTTTGQADNEYGQDGAPVPVAHMDWHIDRRQLLASQRGSGSALDVTALSQIAREVNSRFEDAFTNGWNVDVGGHEMQGFTNHPDRNQVSAPGDFGDDTTDADDIRTTFLRIIEALEDDEYDPNDVRVWSHRNQWQEMRSTIADFGSGNPGDANMRGRIQDEFPEIGDMNVTPALSDGEMVAYVPLRETVEAGVANEVDTIEWDAPHGFTHHFKVWGAMNLELKSQENGQMGVVHVTGA